MIRDERWLPVRNHEGLYEVSSCGSVRSVDRTTTMRTRGDRITLRSIVGSVLSASDRGNGYLSVRLYKDKRPKTYNVHTLVLEAFVSPRPDGLVGRHLKGDPADCRSDNLRWGTPSENMIDSVEHGTNAKTRQTSCIRGHELAGPNLQWITLGRRRPQRICRACRMARSRVGDSADHEQSMQWLSDALHHDLVSGIEIVPRPRKLSSQHAIEIRALRGEGVMQKLLAEMYGVSEPTISRIINVRGVA